MPVFRICMKPRLATASVMNWAAHLSLLIGRSATQPYARDAENRNEAVHNFILSHHKTRDEAEEE